MELSHALVKVLYEQAFFYQRSLLQRIGHQATLRRLLVLDSGCFVHYYVLWRSTSDGIVMSRCRDKFIHSLDGFCMCLIEFIEFNLILLKNLVQILKGKESVVFESDRIGVSNQLLEVGPARIETRPVVSHKLPVIRKEVPCVDRPFKLRLFSFLLDSLHVVINGAEKEVELPSIGMIHQHGSCVLKKCIVDVCKLPGKVHAGSDHNVICLVVCGIIIETSQKNSRV